MAGDQYQLLVAKMASTMRANLLLKRCNAVLGKLKDSIMSFDSFMELFNTPLSGTSELFFHESFDKATEKSSHVLYNEAIRETVTLEKKPSKKTTKKIQFPQAITIRKVFWSPVLLTGLWEGCFYFSFYGFLQGFFFL